MTKSITKTTLAALALGLSVPAMAATDGSPGATSTGSFTTSLTVLAPANNDGACWVFRITPSDRAIDKCQCGHLQNDRFRVFQPVNRGLEYSCHGIAERHVGGQRI
ncbi:MAG: hypothetical protein IPN84_08455 [Sphingomonadales bacterium]|nr:hypothetical protein [Sphingomonadales bacterium]